jgi:hypothetical protein
MEKEIKTQAICERCEKTVVEVWPCEQCEQMVCEDCTVAYDQFNQIDFTCCKGCYSASRDY